MLARVVATVSVAVALVPSLAAASEALENGQVLIGTAERGAALADDGPVEPLLVTIDTPYEVFDQSGTFVHVAAWLPDGTPAAGARVYLAQELVGRADETGTLVFRWGVPGSEIEDYWTNASAVQVRFEHEGRTHGGSVGFSALSRTESFESDHVYVYTDRGVYNPGQTVRLRSIAWNLAIDWSPVAEAEIEYLLLDPQSRVVGGTSVATNVFGVAAAEIPLSEHAEEGLYTLRASYEGAEAEARLRVERFVPPVIEIDHTLGRFITRDQAELAFDVTLSYFTGGAFGSGQMTVEIIRNGASVWRTEQSVAGAGPHSVRLAGETLDGLRADWVEGERLGVRISVSDDAGRSDELTRDLTFRANPYIAVIELDRQQYSEGDPVEAIVRLTDVERVPVRDTELRLETSRGERLTQRTDEHGTAQFSLVMGDAGFDVSFFLADVETPVAVGYVGWQESQPMRSHVAEAIVSEGQETPITIRFPSHFEPAESVVHVDIVDSSGSLVGAALVPIGRRDGVWVAEGSFRAPSWGSMLLTMFCLGRDTTSTLDPGERGSPLGLMTEGQNLAVHPNRELVVTLDGLPDRLSPGQAWEAEVRVTDPAGRPVAASVGAAVVDRAVISLKDPLEITPMDHFYNPELRVISTTGSAILTWPVVSRNWGVNTHDIALPPFPFHEGGAIAMPARRLFAADAESEEAGEILAEGYGAGGLSVTGSGSGGGGSGVGYGTMQMQMGSAVAGAAPEEPTAGLRGRSDGGQLAQPVIAIRTEFPETSLWAPLLETAAADGAVVIAGQMPDAITEQQLSVVVSDASGGVGVLRQAVAITQPVHVRADLPDVLTVGDRLTVPVVVENLGEVSDDFRVSLSSDDLRVSGGSPPLAVAPGAVGVARFTIEADAPGDFEITAAARGASFDDRETRTIHVRPRGEPTEAVVVAERRGDFWQAEVEVPSDGQLTTVTLNVSFPAVTTAFAGLDALRKQVVEDNVAATGGELIATALVYQYAVTHDLAPAERDGWRIAIERARGRLLAAQRADGGWGFWWDAASSPYITGYCLEALLLLQDLDLLVPDAAIERAAGFLVGARDGDTWDMATIAFWEGNTTDVRLGLTAEIFAVLADLPEPYRTDAWRTELAALGRGFDDYLDDDSPDLLTLGYALLGLHRLAEAGVIEVDGGRLVDAARRLSEQRREGHWEPSWFNAYGGTIEASAVALEVLDALGVEVSAAEQRELVRQLLSTRDGWGGWHNPRGTAAAIEALLRLAPPATDVASRVEVRVDEVLVRELAIDPADPFLSAISLSALDLTPYLEPGDHSVRVLYDGTLEPDVRVVTRHWGEAVAAEADTIALTAALSSTDLSLGETFELTIDVRSTTGERPQIARIDVAPPANAAIDPSSLDDLLARGLVSAIDRRDGNVRLYLELPENDQRRLTIRLQAVRAGTAALPEVTAAVLGGAATARAVAAIETPLVVR